VRTKKVKAPPKEFEYQLIVSPDYDEVSKRKYLAFHFKTTKEFLTFQYILKIKNKFDGNNIFFKISGFSAPVGELSNHGYAGYEYRLYDFKPGEYNITVEKMDAEKCRFTIKIQNSRTKTVKLKNFSGKQFIQVITE
jgi:hypothetical protein